MSFSESAGTTIVPTLARLVLAGVFITAGYQKVFVEVPYTAEQAEALRGLGVDLGVAPASAMHWGGAEVEFVLASHRQDGDAGGGDDTQDAGGDAGQDPPPDTDDQETGGADDAAANDAEIIAQDQPEELTPGAVNPVDGEVMGKGAYHIALMVDHHGWPEPTKMAWVASYTELIGGVLILVGLFSRLWGVGLAITMGVAFYFTSWSGLADASFNLFKISESDLTNGTAAFSTMFLQLSLCVLALTVLFAGPGPISIDRLLFGKSATGAEEEI